MTTKEQLEVHLLDALYELEYLRHELEQYYLDRRPEESSSYDIRYFDFVLAEHSSIYTALGAEIEISSKMISDYRKDERTFRYLKAMDHIKSRFDQFVTFGKAFDQRFWAMPHAAANSDTKGWIRHRLDTGRYVPKSVCPKWYRDGLPAFEWKTLGQ